MSSVPVNSGRATDYREIEAVDFDFLAGNLGIACEA
jgi:hypothetical protein